MLWCCNTGFGFWDLPHQITRNAFELVGSDFLFGTEFMLLKFQSFFKSEIFVLRTMNTSEKLCLQWNDFKVNVSASFGELREDRDLYDVTLACEDGKEVEAHKVVLASSSPFFMELLKKNKHPHPLIYMRGLKFEDLLAILDFLYLGQANISQERPLWN